jgi:glycerate-2-kinase
VLGVEGAIVVPEGTEVPNLAGVLVLRGEHPIPGPLGESSTKRLVEVIGATSAASFVCLLSGGASSLLAAPIRPLNLADKQQVTSLLLRSGAAIEEINCVRKHLSTVKGGRMLRLARSRPVLSLLVSDVVGDAPSTIGSGPTVPDESTFSEAIEVLRGRGIYDSCPVAVRDVLERGVRGELEETVRPATPEAALATPMVIGSNATACAAAAQAAARLGYLVERRDGPLSGDTTDSAIDWFRTIERGLPPSRPTCFIAGGETTVRVAGKGKGGRNQEFALALVEATRGRNVSVLSAGTDGVDGPTDMAGAFVDGTTFDRARAVGMASESYLEHNDSFHFFEQLGDLFGTGPTGTNVMDLKLAVALPASAP